MKKTLFAAVLTASLLLTACSPSGPGEQAPSPALTPEESPLDQQRLDEEEFQALGGDPASQDQIIIPDQGQDYVEAALEHCRVFTEKHLLASPGSQFCYTYVDCRVTGAEEQAELLRGLGEIDENTYAFYLEVVFVPENPRAEQWSMAGNTREYPGDGLAPEGAYVYDRCGYITRTAEGWRGNIVGTGW